MVLLTATVGMDIIYSYYMRVEYIINYEMEDSFWLSRNSVFAKRGEPSFPLQLPGPLDAWAGSVPKEITFKAPFSRDTKLLACFADSHDVSPPVLEISVSGRGVSSVAVEKGYGRGISQLDKGKPSCVSVFIESGYLDLKEPLVSMRTKEGSWVVFSGLTLLIQPKPWEYIILVFGWIPLLLWIKDFYSFIQKRSLMAVQYIYDGKDIRACFNETSLYIFSVLLVSVLYFAFYALFSLKGTDIAAHQDFIKNYLANGEPLPPHFGFHLAVMILSGFSANLADMRLPSVVILAVSFALKYILTVSLVSRWVKTSEALWISALVMFCAPIFLYEPIYLGQISGLVLHNPTTIMVFPFSIAVFMYSLRGRFGIVAILSVLSLFVKPNYILAWGVAFLCHQMITHGLSKKVIADNMKWLFPVIAILTWQYLSFTGSGAGIDISPFKVWSDFSGNIPLSIARSLAFPLCFVLLFHDTAIKDTYLKLAWAVLLVAIFQAALLFESGFRGFHGNWFWGMNLAVYIVFAISVSKFYDTAVTLIQNKRRFLAVAFTFTLLVAHTLSGVCYMILMVWRNSYSSMTY